MISLLDPYYCNHHNDAFIHHHDPISTKKLITTPSAARRATSISTKLDHNNDDLTITMTPTTDTNNMNDTEHNTLFEEWFRTKIPNSYVDSSILVGNTFHSSLRGLIWNDTNNNQNISCVRYMEIMQMRVAAIVLPP